MSSSPLTPAPFHPRRPHLVAPVRIDPAGQAGPTPAMARTTEWRRTSRGRYVPAWVDGSLVEQRIVEAAATLPAYAGVTGWAALRWLGGRWFTGTDASGELPVTLAVAGHAVRAQRGVVPSSERIGPVDLTSHDGLAVTTPTRSVCFEMRYAATLWLAVAALDMAAFSDLVSIAEVQSYADAHSGWTGIPQCREAIPLAVENSWSPQETWMRQVWTGPAGLPAPLCNTPIFDRHGRHVGTPDLLDLEAGLVGEYDGSYHLLGSQRSADVTREEGFRSVGLECVTAMAADHRDPAGLVGRILSARSRCRFEPQTSRQWTVDPPAWWTVTTTVEQRRALAGDQRRRLLAHRAA